MKTAMNLLPDLPLTMTVPFIARKVLLCSPNKVYQLIREGHLRGIVFSSDKATKTNRGNVRVLAEDLRDFILRHRTGGMSGRGTQ